MSLAPLIWLGSIYLLVFGVVVEWIVGVVVDYVESASLAADSLKVVAG